MNRTAIFPGSFDPFTIGHESILLRGLELFDRVILGIGSNSSKKCYFPIADRKSMIEDLFAHEPRISVQIFEGLTVDFAEEVNAQYILRGLRTAADFEYERAIAQINNSIRGIETVFLLTRPEHTPISSTIVREILSYGEDVSHFLPANLNLSNYNRQ